MAKKTLELLNDGKNRCGWCNKSVLYQRYHDEEWGRALHDEHKHFEFLLLETMQAGLSWYTILQRREGYRNAFANFNVVEVAKFDQSKIEELMLNTAIIRNRLKIEAAVHNAKLFIQIQQEHGSFDNYIWGFTDNQVIDNCWASLSQVPATSELSDRVAKDLKTRGFKFVGSTTIYAHLQAIGVINDHLVDCWVNLSRS
ncbi:MAG: DNA-3-methyladenine glycosylase I [Neisseriales bacterium]|nr:MAG: DNA-3-methyladenine glycosylase I [Neisseriales bacterium]